MAPKLEDYLIPDNFMPCCRDCAKGACLSLTVFFRGLGRQIGPVIRYSAEESNFPRQLTARLLEGEQKCCRKELMIAGYDPELNIPRNASALAAMIRANLANKGQVYPWLTKINLHLVGFSAGGLLALEVARTLDISPVISAAMWCDLPKNPSVAIEMDLVTIATPFDLEIDLGFADFWAWVREYFGDGAGFFTSVGASEYGGDGPPATLCAFTAFVSSEKHGDDSPGADQDPREDEQLPGWFDDNSAIPAKAVIPLKDEWPLPDDEDDEDDPNHVSHTAVLPKVLDTFGSVLAPGCACLVPPTPSSPGD